MNLENGTIINQYKILSPIGKGGMGEVYLAEDTKLERRIAIKFLNDEFSRDADKVSRFIREAKAASALNHPNILTVYEIGAEGGTNYIAAEFIDGKSLTDHISQDKISLESVLELSIQIVSALQTAHVAGIVHRDIKPDNVMIRRDGIVKVLDFGLAKLAEKPSAGDLNLEAATIAKIDTVPGVVMGTPNYMSPEQARGKDIDRQTDIFSFGIVLYEMLTRKLPFAGETVSDIIASVLTKEPRPIEEFNESVPANLREIVSKTLEKDKSKRYQTADELLEDLKKLKKRIESGEELERTILPQTDAAETQILQAATTGDDARTTGKNSRVSVSLEKSSLNKILAAVAGVLLVAAIGLGYWFYSTSTIKQIESIAVMPFENRSGNADSEYLSDGLAESLIYRLSQLPDLKVSPTSSVFRYKGKETDPQVVAKELGVDSVLTGRIAQRGDNLTISVNLVDTRNGKSLWGEQYERKMSELLQTQREIAAEITNNLKLKLSGESEQKLAKKYTDNDEAYQLYLKGRYHYARRTKDDMQRGIEYFQQAVNLDPNFALAYVGIADSYNTMPSYAYLSPQEAYPKAKIAAQKALAIDNALAEAHSALAYPLAHYDLNWTEAEREYRRAIELNPNVAQIHYQFGLVYLLPMGRIDEAAAELKRALELEPLSIPMSANLAGVYMYARQYDLALEQARKTSDLDPNHPTTRFWLGVIYTTKGMNDEAIALSEKILQIDPANQDGLFIAGYAYAKANRRSNAEAVIRRFKEIEKTEYVNSYYIASIYAALGERAEAFTELEKSFSKREYFIPLLKVDPPMDDLRDDARFKDLLKRMNLPE